MRRSYLFSSAIFIACAVLTFLAYKTKFIKIKDVIASEFAATFNVNISPKEICIQSNEHDDLFDEINGCYNSGAIDNTSNAPYNVLKNLKPVMVFLSKMEIGFIALAASCAGMALFKFGLAFYPKNLLLNTLYDLVHIAVITGGLVMVLFLIFLPSYMKYKGLDNDKLKSENNIDTFNSFYLNYKAWDIGTTFICVVYGLLIVELLVNRTSKIFRKRK